MTESLRRLLLTREPLRTVTLRDLAILALSLAGLTSSEIARLRGADVKAGGDAGIAIVVRRARRLTRIPLDQWERAALLRYIEAWGHWGQDLPLWSSSRGTLTAGGVRRALLRVRHRAEERSA